MDAFLGLSLGILSDGFIPGRAGRRQSRSYDGGSQPSGGANRQGARGPSESFDTYILIGPDFSAADFGDRFVRGAVPLLAYGLVGMVEQAILAPLDYQIPLAFGFTLETGWSSPTKNYDYQAYRDNPDDPQWDAHLSGQTAIGEVRTHTTGILNYGTIHEWPLAQEALELVHPGTTAILLGDSYGDSFDGSE